MSYVVEHAQGLVQEMLGQYRLTGCPVAQGCHYGAPSHSRRAEAERLPSPQC
ncbi:MAG: hypothetical protein KatS3mg114_1173 [Planctomycetaceae bacterium]|nr:MAG: hypothetical protein KatS3mg114_1173 [Planctomycetaceae bacterium]